MTKKKKKGKNVVPCDSEEKKTNKLFSIKHDLPLQNRSHFW